MAQIPVQTLHRDPQLFYWILIPITVVMVLTGVLRHYASVLMATAPKKLEARALREQRALARGVALRSNYHALSQRAFEARREGLTAGYESGAFLKEPERKGQPPANPLTDPSQMDGMMGMMKNNMAMIIPNTLIMSWINAFFSGYVIMKLPFPITIKFKSMLQAGVQTKDMDPRWMSSISWYFLCIFGLQFVYVFLLGSDNAASQMAQQMAAQQMPMGGMGGPGQDPDKQFKAEAENLAVVEHYSVLDDVEERLLEGIKS
ncbi:protein UCP010045, transmembrane [Purpureocillium lilacinum]|uniref:ER membrane protein complex subunit 3 n=1 Tax=Purpureocillium lilacinum TaxID=33203 RepID=A0A179HZD9_PURLI|nr:protein UCP010045, transmembrane [Purpureocillium lilacinum]OAQ95262.1 protein UCP010045, transmembrane [Purpureocillium lilacinum]GJN66514.1 ER membrane complex subunit 3 [Purpureocillium lilacinum]GJN80457.1 ER membrane complex subunit 3 [Purpureocillium lilacinum]